MAASIAPQSGAELPHDLDAERAVLGAVIVDDSRLDDVQAAIDPQAFYRQAHRTILERMLDMRGRDIPIDERTLNSELKRFGELDEVGGPAYIGALTTGVPRGSNIAAYAKTVAETARARRIISDLSAAASHALSGRIGTALELAASASRSGAEHDTNIERLQAMRANDLIALPRPTEIIEGIAAANGITVLVSESGTGKTFVLLSQAAHVSAGITWHSRHVVRGSVVYISFEGDSFGTRLRATRDIQGHQLAHVHIVRAVDPLSPRATRDGAEEPSVGELETRACLVSLAERLALAHEPPIVLLVVDTARASMSGSEDNSGDVSAYIRAIRRLLACVPGAAAVLAHHAGWQDGESQRKRERGSSAWRGNSDIVVYLEAGEYDRDRGEAELTLRTLKTRDGEQLPPLRLVRRRVALAEFDRYGQPVTSCVIEPDHRSREDREAAQAATVAAEAMALDFQTLKAIGDRPDLATSREAIRSLVGRAKRDVSESVDRLIRSGMLKPGRRGEPFSVTAAGLTSLQAAL